MLSSLSSFLLHFLADEVPDEAVEGLVLALSSKGSAVGVHVRSIDETRTSSIADLPELLRPSHLCRSLLDFAVRVFPLGELGVTDHVGVVGSRLADTVHHMVLLGELTRYALDRVDKGYFCHMCSAIEHRVRLKPKLSKIFFDDNCDNIPLESTLSSGEGYYFQQLKQLYLTTLPLTTTQLAAWNILLERPRDIDLGASCRYCR